MKRYVDGFVVVVPRKKLVSYKKLASKAGKAWVKHGALQYFECVGDELYPDTYGTPMLTFPKMTKAKPSEVIFYSFIVYKSKTHRNSVNKKVMKEFKDDDCKDIPFDPKKMAWGGFTSIVYYE